jgi:hypothetical protein
MLAVAAAVAAQTLGFVAAAYAGGDVVTAVPEPMTIGLLTAGSALAAVGAWWKNRK